MGWLDEKSSGGGVGLRFLGGDIIDLLNGSDMSHRWRRIKAWLAKILWISCNGGSWMMLWKWLALIVMGSSFIKVSIGLVDSPS